MPLIYLFTQKEFNILFLIVIELGAGCALPSLLMSALPEGPTLVVITDYPDPGIIGNLQRNVDRNRAHFADSCAVICQGYEWGADTASLWYVRSGRR